MTATTRTACVSLVGSSVPQSVYVPRRLGGVSMDASHPAAITPASATATQSAAHSQRRLGAYRRGIGENAE